MRSRPAYAVVLGLLLAWGAAAEESEADFLLEFLPGRYRVVGQEPDSGECYRGEVTLARSGDRLKVVRSIGGERVEGVGAIETATADRVRILRVRFGRGGREYEGTYLIGSDLDNRARLSGLLYRRDGGTRQPGLEALFADPGE